MRVLTAIYTMIFGDDTQAPWWSMPCLLRLEFNTEGHILLAKTQPSFILCSPGGAASSAKTP